MFKSIRNIIIVLAILLLFAIIPIIMSLSLLGQSVNMAKETDIVINDNGRIKITDGITLLSDESKFYKTISIQRSLFVDDQEREFGTKQPENLEVTLNGEKLKETGSLNSSNTSYYTSSSGVVIKNINILENEINDIQITYEYDIKDAVEEYNNVTVLKLMTGDKISKSNIEIKLPQETERFELETSAKIEYLGNNTYSINGKMKSPYTELLIDNGTIKNAKIINEEYETSNIKKTLMSEDGAVIYFLIGLSVITVIIFITTLILTRKVKVEKNYVRNPEEVIEPILAESIIDRKIGAKELIMSCIVDLIYRGNLKNIGNDQIQLLHYNNMSEYELEILRLLFKQEGQIITFDEISQMFYDNSKTQSFYDKFNIIKRKIEEKLFNYHIYSKLGEQILKLIRVISINVLFYMAYLLYIVVMESKKMNITNLIYLTIIGIIVSTSVVYSKLDIRKLAKNKRSYTTNSVKLKLNLTMLIVCVLTMIFSQGYKHIGALAIIAMNFILNIIVLKKAKLHVFTQTGKLEFARAKGLKDYIVDYSLMKERDIESVIIWDEYLAYAVAFGIPNKITDKFNENLMNANIVIQNIEAILKM